MSLSSQAFRWTAATGMVGLGFTRPGHTQSEARAISRDGSTIVGWSADLGSGIRDAFAWTQATGMAVLPPLPNSFVSSYAFGMNHDASLIVGVSGPSTDRAVMWVNRVPLDLGVAPGWTRSQALMVSDAGGVVLGELGQGGQQVPAVWTPTTGFMTFGNYLALNSISVPSGYTIRSVNGMSGDGRTFCGDLFADATSPAQAFVVTIPTPTALAILALSGAGAALRRRR